ncbi:hypothetical protein ABZ470_39765 [Streptosporangium sp. NPDC020072]|uniref:hypothetical protein n=1 Tax=Streptosporangium sp. NPDC020072 TaxID=3154788 RepID=UPI003435AF46
MAALRLVRLAVTDSPFGGGRQAAALLPTKKDHTMLQPGIPTTENWFTEAYHQGMAPMALRLAVEGIDFTFGHVGDDALLNVPIASISYVWVTSTLGNAPGTCLEELRWHLRILSDHDPSQDIGILLGDEVATEAAIDLISMLLNVNPCPETKAAAKADREPR